MSWLCPGSGNPLELIGVREDGVREWGVSVFLVESVAQG